MVLSIWVCLTAALLTAGPAASRALDVLADFQGIRYDETGRPVGLPMGGVGAGSIEITSQGTLAEFANVNNWAARIPSIPGTGLWVTYTVGGKTHVFSLAGGKVRFEGDFPFAKLTFPDMPVDVTLWCWSPFILHDLRRSAYPAAVFDAEIANTGSEAAEVGLVLSYGTDYGNWLQNLAVSKAEQVPVVIKTASSPYVGRRASGISFHAKAELDAAAFEARLRKLRQGLEDAYLRPYDYAPVDIRSACNRSYLKSPFGVDPGNAKLCFADMKAGKRQVYGIPFEIIDDAASGGKSCAMARGATREPAVTIPVGQKAECLFFLGNCAGWATGANVSAEYVVRYRDGTKHTVPLRPGYEICDWMGGSAIYCPAQVYGQNGAGGSYVVNVFAVPTDESREIESVELRQSGDIAPIVFAVTVGRLSKTPVAEGVVAMRRVDVDRMAGNVESSKLVSNTDAGYTLAARSLDGGRVFTYQIPTPDGLPIAIEKGQQSSGSTASVYAVEQRFRLEPGQKAAAGLLCTWYAPNHRDRNGHRFGHKYEEWFADSAAAAEEIARDHDRLLADTKRHYDLIATSTLPKWYREMVQSNFYLMPACTWLTKDGIAFTYETPNGCPLFGTMDVRYYGSFTKLAAFPELDAKVLRQFAAVQHPDGFIQHDLGGSSGITDTYAFPVSPSPAPVPPRKNRHEYDGCWVNLPIKFCLQVARHYQWAGDKAFLQDMWPHVKRAITWVKAQDEDNDGLPETNYGYDGWKMIDKSNYDANQWIAMLPAIARLAEDLGESDYAFELRVTHRKALAQVQKLLWTGKYYRQAVHNDTGNNDMVSLLQVAGDWYADILGFDDGLPRDQVRSALKTIDAVNGKDAVYGATDCLFPDGSRNDSWICIGQAIGWQYFYASHCMYEGLDDIALRIADETWRQFTVEEARIPWCQEEFIADPRKGECPYWLLRDMRMGSTMVMSYAAAGLKLDLPRGTAAIVPADWVWKDSKFVLPILMPRWLGQVKYSRKANQEVYEISNVEKPVVLKSLRLRIERKGMALVTIGSKTRKCKVDSDGTVDIGPVEIGRSTRIRCRD